MSRLTLEWHLRGIVEGTTDIEREVVGYEESVGKRWPIREVVDEGSYTTGFTRDSGHFCDVSEVPVRRALAAEDTVAFLDTLAHDPTKRFQVRNDAAWLLDKHIWPDSPRHTNSIHNAEREDITVAEWSDAGLVRTNIGPTYLPPRCVNPDCSEGECLADPDALRDDGSAVCMVCGTEQPIPEYP